MPKIGFFFLSFFITLSSYSQGTVELENQSQNDGAGAPIYYWTGPYGPGAGFTAGLWVNGVEAGITQFYSSCLNDAFLRPVVLTVPFQPGTEVTFEVKVWQDLAGSYENDVLRMTSGPFQGVIGGGGGPPGKLENLPSIVPLAPRFPRPHEGAILIQGCASKPIVFSWINPSTPFTLQFNTSLVSEGWTEYSGPVTYYDDLARVQIATSQTQLFFRLVR
jgi:hypothetical protein